MRNLQSYRESRLLNYSFCKLKFPAQNVVVEQKKALRSESASGRAQGKDHVGSWQIRKEGHGNPDSNTLGMWSGMDCVQLNKDVSCES